MKQVLPHGRDRDRGERDADTERHRGSEIGTDKGCWRETHRDPGEPWSALGTQ